MSDENKSYWMEQYIENQNKIVVFEQRISELEKTQITKVFYEQWVDKLTELEKKGKNHNDSIIELRSLIQSNAISDLNHYDELKEMLNVVAQARIGWEETIDSTLRQLFKKFEDSHDEAINRRFFTKLLEKLDSQGKTEKKEPCEHDWVYTTANRERCSKCKEIKASGGEKD